MRSLETLYQLAANGDAKAAAEYERRTTSHREPPPIFLSGDEIKNPPSWAKGHKVTDGKTVWIA